MTNAHFTSVDLFCGAGGLTMGLKLAGFDCAYALDADRNACETFRRNGLGEVVNGTLHENSADEILSAIGRKRGDISLVCGGPPCQGFSLQRRGPRDDIRNDLVIQFFHTALKLNPRFILMENVAAVLGKRGRPYIDEVQRLLEQNGYSHDAAVLDAADYGVPQHRLRAFVVAWRSDITVGFGLPEPTHCSGTWRTVRQAIGDLPEPSVDHLEHAMHANHTRVRISTLNTQRIACVPEGGGRLNLPPELQLPCHKNANGHRHLDVYGRMVWNQPAPTITAMFDNFTRGRFAHPSENRSITAREGARLQTFPDSFRFFGPKKDVARQIGNAVPPLLARTIGEAIKCSLLGHRKAGGVGRVQQLQIPF